MSHPSARRGRGQIGAPIGSNYGGPHRLQIRQLPGPRLRLGRMSREYVLQPFRAPSICRLTMPRELNEQQLRGRDGAAGAVAGDRGGGFGQDAHAHLSRGLSAGAGDSAGAHSAAHVHEQGGQGNDAARGGSAGAGTGVALGRDVSLDRQPHPAPARRPARLPARLHHPGPRGRQAPDHHVRGGVGGGREGDALSEGRGAGRHLFAGGQHAQGRFRRFWRSNTTISRTWRRRLRTSSSVTRRASGRRTRWISTICWRSGSS